MPEHRTIHTVMEERTRRMAIASARRDRADSLAYHRAASIGETPEGELIYPAAGSPWDAMGIARLASMGLVVAMKSYRSARVTPAEWSACHGALVAAALAKGAAPIECGECGERAAWLTPAPSTDGSGYPTCAAHRPPLTRTVDLPARVSVGVGYWQETASEDSDGNVIVGREFVTPRATVAAGSATVPLARRIETDRMPTVGEVNGAWMIERAKGMLADLWAGAPILTAWDTSPDDGADGDDAEEGSEEEDLTRWASAIQWEDLAPHLGADTPAERMLLDTALTGIDLKEAGSKATVYGAAKPMAHPAARKASSRAAKALAARHDEATIRAAVLAALEETEAAEVASGEAATTLAPATMRNAKTPAWEARLGLADVASGRALRSAWLARHLWPMRRTLPTPGLASREVLALPVMIGNPALPVRVPVWRNLKGERAARAAHRRTAAQRAAAARTAAAARIALDPMAHYAEVWQRADDAAATAAAMDTGALATIARASDARKRAGEMKRHAERTTSTPCHTMRRTLPAWTPEERTGYLATLPAHTPLEVPTPATLPADATAADAARKMEAARDLADTLRTALGEPQTPSHAGTRRWETRNPAALTNDWPHPGQDTHTWPMDTRASDTHTRTLTAAESKREAAAKTAHAQRIDSLPTAERMDWQRRCDAQMKRAAKRAARAAK